MSHIQVTKFDLSARLLRKSFSLFLLEFMNEDKNTRRARPGHSTKYKEDHIYDIAANLRRLNCSLLAAIQTSPGLLP